MHELGLSTISTWISEFFHVEKLSDGAVLIIGILVGLIAKNVYMIAMRSLGFAGGFASRLAIGWWEELRREAPNVIDFALVVVAECDGSAALHMDPLLGPRRLNDVYLNPRTAFGIRLQTFSVSRDEPWVTFAVDERRGIFQRMHRLWWHGLRGRRAPRLTPEDRLMLKYRRVYAPIEQLIGQYLTNQWAIQMAIGEPCHVFHFVIALVYEKSDDPHVDRHFHALVIWEDMLLRQDMTDVVTFLPEYRQRLDTILRIGAYYRSAPHAARTFGSLHVMIPKRSLQHAYFVSWTENIDGEMVPVSRPITDDSRSPSELGRPPRALRAARDDAINPLD